MDTHIFDEEKSRMVYKYCKDDIKLKECYSNVFRVTFSCIEKFKSGDWKIAYGFFPVDGNIYARHCFIIDEYGKAIDPTAMLHKTRGIGEYYSFAILTIDEWIDAIVENDRLVGLLQYFGDAEYDFRKYAFANNMILLD